MEKRWVEKWLCNVKDKHKEKKKKLPKRAKSQLGSRDGPMLQGDHSQVKSLGF